MDVPELAGIVPQLAERSDDLHRIPLHDPDLVVGSIRYVKEPLIRSEVEVEGGAGSQRLRRDESFLDVLAILMEDLHAVTVAVAHVDQAVLREPDAVHGDGERSRRRTIRI